MNDAEKVKGYAVLFVCKSWFLKLEKSMSVAVKEQDNSGLYRQLQQCVLKYSPSGDFAAEHLLIYWEDINTIVHVVMLSLWTINYFTVFTVQSCTFLRVAFKSSKSPQYRQTRICTFFKKKISLQQKVLVFCMWISSS